MTDSFVKGTRRKVGALRLSTFGWDVAVTCMLRQCSHVLCDWPIAKGKTCDRGICEECAPPVAPDLHYCKAHRALWEQFKADELRGVVFAQFTGPNKPKRKPKDKRR